MTLAERIKKLMAELGQGLIERDGILRLAFLAIVTEQPTYLYGRAGSGKRAILTHLINGFKDLNCQVFGRRSFNLPTKESPADLAVFTSFDGAYIPMTNAIQAILDEHLANELLLFGRLRPDASLSEAGISDNIHLVLTLPDSVSPEALPDLLSSAGDPNRFSASEDLKITHADLVEWKSAIEKVSISEDCLIVLQKIAAECEQSNVYISAKRWRGLAKIARAEAFFAGRSETNITDFLFLSQDLWGKRSTNETIGKGFVAGMNAYFDKYAPNPEELRKSIQGLLLSAEHYKNATGNIYKTTSIHDEDYIRYAITVAGETISLYAPVSKLGTSDDFHPLNELKRIEKRAKCNFMGGDVCKISIDSKAKQSGMRASTSALSGSTNANSVFEDFAKLPSEILRQNDPETLEKNRIGLEDAHEKLFQIVTDTARNLKVLKDLYAQKLGFQKDPFLEMGAYQNFMNYILKRHKALSDLCKELQQYEAELERASTGIR